MNKMNFLTRLVFYWKKPPLIVVCGKQRLYSSEAIYQALGQYLQIKKFETEKEKIIFSIHSLLKNRAFVIETDLKKPEYSIELLKKSRLPILVINNIGEIPFSALELAKKLPPQGILILNSDDRIPLQIKSECQARILTFGFGETALFRASDVRLNKGTNFKINYKGNIVPVWLEKLFGREQIYAALTAAAVGTTLNLNLVEISQALKSYQGLEKTT
jgi:UDP-N-acetylmuramyl pentapeptide synthase